MKDKTVFVCQGCGARSPKWLGRCSACGEWNTLVEEVEEESASLPGGIVLAPAEPVLYKDVADVPRQRLALGIEDFNKVLGGGLVPGSVVLLGGEPGIGKSTLLLQVARDMTAAGAPVLYVSGEESIEQIKLRGDRLGVRDGRLYLLAETQLERILAQA
ncbi:MAG: AAA family ATPase, partial [Acidobacteria bacterium]|nr:AAA family ATPase [Acidobacteriota bacterium]